MSPTAPELTIVVISYNTKDLLLACLASVFAETTTPVELIVVDNASSDGSAEAVEAAFPQVTVLKESENHGFGPAHHIALREATAPWLLCLNPDTVVLNGAIDRLLAFAKAHPDAGIWGGRTVFADGSLNPMSCFGRMTLWSTFCRVAGLNGVFRRSELFNSEYFGDWPRDTVRQVDIVSGCFFLLRRETWDRLGGFDPAFTMYGEETDLCLRAAREGLRPMVTPEAEIIHYAGASETVAADKLVRMMRAKTELIIRHFPPATRGLGRLLFALWPLSRTVAFGLGATLLRRPNLRARQANWHEVWRRRSEWRAGYGGGP